MRHTQVLSNFLSSVSVKRRTHARTQSSGARVVTTVANATSAVLMLFQLIVKCSRTLYPCISRTTASHTTMARI